MSTAKESTNKHKVEDLSATEHDDTLANEHMEPQDAIHEVMGEELDQMYEIIMQIREDEDFAKSIYSNCPRLQHMLDLHPDLRPVFEDPHLVRINFEDVYRKAGGILPEDTITIKQRVLKVVARIVRHPLFKVFRFLLVIKKIYNCLMTGGINCVRGCLCALCLDAGAEAAAEATETDVDADADPDANPENELNREKLNAAADYMEGANSSVMFVLLLVLLLILPASVLRLVWLFSFADGFQWRVEMVQFAYFNCYNALSLKNSFILHVASHTSPNKILKSDPEVQERMQNILDNDPDKLAEAIENDPELRALRDSSPICAELMSDPETMRIVVDPDNLRALSDCPDLVQQDFANPNWSPPDVEQVPFDDEIANPDGEAPDAEQTEVSGTEDEDGNPLEDFERGEVDEEGNPLEDYERGEVDTAKKAGGKKGDKKSEEKGARGTFAKEGFLGLMDLAAAELVGVGFSEITGGGDDELDQLAEQAEDTAEATAENAETAAASAMAAAEFAASDDVAGNLEDAMDGLEDTHEGAQDESDRGNRAAASGAAVGGVAVVGGSGNAEDEDEDEEEKPKKGRFRAVGGAIGGFAAAMSTAAKETVLAQVIGDDFAEDLVDKMEESDEEEEKEEEKEGSKGGSTKPSGKKK